MGDARARYCPGEGTKKRLHDLAILRTYETDKKRKHREVRRAKLQSLPTPLNLLDSQVRSSSQRFTSRLARFDLIYLFIYFEIEGQQANVKVQEAVDHLTSYSIK